MPCWPHQVLVLPQKCMQHPTTTHHLYCCWSQLLQWLINSLVFFAISPAPSTLNTAVLVLSQCKSAEVLLHTKLSSEFPSAAPLLRAKSKVLVVTRRPDMIWRPAAPLTAVPAARAPHPTPGLPTGPWMHGVRPTDRLCFHYFLCLRWSSSRNLHDSASFFISLLKFNLSSERPSLTTLPKRMVLFILICCPPQACHHLEDFILSLFSPISNQLECNIMAPHLPFCLLM